MYFSGGGIKSSKLPDIAVEIKIFNLCNNLNKRMSEYWKINTFLSSIHWCLEQSSYSWHLSLSLSLSHLPRGKEACLEMGLLLFGFWNCTRPNSTMLNFGNRLFKHLNFAFNRVVTTNRLILYVEIQPGCGFRSSFFNKVKDFKVSKEDRSKFCIIVEKKNNC